MVCNGLYISIKIMMNPSYPAKLLGPHGQNHQGGADAIHFAKFFEDGTIDRLANLLAREHAATAPFPAILLMVPSDHGAHRNLQFRLPRHAKAFACHVLTPEFIGKITGAKSLGRLALQTVNINVNSSKVGNSMLQTSINLYHSGMVSMHVSTSHFLC